MRIGLVLPNLPAYSETFFRNKVLGLQQHGHEVILFVNSKPKSSNYLDCKIVTAPKLSGNKLHVAISSMIQVVKAVFAQPRKSLNLYKLNRKDGISFKDNLKNIIANQFLLNEKLDWLHYGFGTMALGRENIAQITGSKMAVSFRGFDIGIYPLKHPDCYQKLFQKVDKIHVISDDITELLYKQGLENKKIITKITPAIDTTFFEKTIRKENGTIQFLTIGRLHWKKGLEYTLEALSILKKQGVDFTYTIIGEGIERERLLFAAYQLGIENNVKFAGKLPHSEVKIHLEQAAIYLQYSIQEGFCNAVLEAQAMGLLCIVSDAEGLSENVLHNQTGWVVPKRKPELLAEKIREVLALDTKRKNEIADKAVQRVKDEFNVEKQVVEFVKFYKE